jgi:hypothetical protein
MDQLISFGKYKGKTFGYVLEEYPGYAKWAMTKFEGGGSKNQCAFLTFLKENFKEKDPKEDKILKDAWYCDPRAKILLKYDLEPKNLCYTISKAKDMALCPVNEITVRQYLQKLDEKILEDWLGTPLEIQAKETKMLHWEMFRFIVEDADNIEYYILPEIANAMMELSDKYDENREQDEQYKSVDQPSKMILSYWISPCLKTTGYKLSGEEKSYPVGKWCLFFNCIKEDEKGLTELDRAYQTLTDNREDIPLKYNFKCSTRRPNSNALSNDTGVIIIYCDEDDRDEIIQKIDDHLELESRVRWKYHSTGYAKNGEKASDHYYDPKLRIQKEEVKQIDIIQPPTLEAPDAAITESANGTYPVYMKYSYLKDIYQEQSEDE